MIRRLTIGVAAVALASTVSSLVSAGPPQDRAVPAVSPDQAGQVFSAARAIGLNPTGEPVRRGPYFVLHAFDARGVEMRVVADAQFGDIVSVVPVFVPRYDAGPRIIHVPQPDDERYIVEEREEEPAREVAPRPRPRKPKAKAQPRRSERPPAPKPRRTVLSAPPPPPQPERELSPVYPTPDFGAKAKVGEPAPPAPAPAAAEQGEKFARPDIDAGVAAPAQD